MNVIAVDDERFALRDLQEAILEALPTCHLSCFQSPLEALSYAKQTQVDVAFLDVEMSNMDGISLAESLKQLHETTNIIFITGHSDYMGEAFALHASGYVLKPVLASAIKKELTHLRYTLENIPKNHIQIKCFGSFDIFVDGKPLLFTRSKAKELLAYLVHLNGSSMSTAKIAAVLWEDREYNRSLQKQTQTVISQMIKTLKDAGIEEIILREWNNLAIDPTKFSCDYYAFLAGDDEAVSSYAGEYMHNYSWGEFTAGELTQMQQRKQNLTQ